MSRKIVVTGATGYIASQVVPFLQEKYDCLLLDVKTTQRSGEEVPGVLLADIHDSDVEQCRGHFVGADAVVHLAFRYPTKQEPSKFEAEMANIRMARNVYEVARLENIRRVVVASSNHAADWYERLYWKQEIDKFGPEIRPLSDNLYGWAKEVYEHLGFVYASGTLSPVVENVHIRIGGPREANLSQARDNLQLMIRQLAVYISPRDMAQLFIKSIEAEDIRNEHGVPFQIFYGVSGNARSFWSILNARNVIGYEPEDDSEVRFAADIQQYLIPGLRKPESDALD